MYICLCNAVTESAVRDAIAEGAQSLAELTAATGCSDTCGACTEAAQALLEDSLERKRSNILHLPVIQAA